MKENKQTEPANEQPDTVTAEETDTDGAVSNEERLSALAADGLKYAAVEKEVKRLQYFAEQSGMSVAAFLDDIEQTRTQKRKQELVDACGGNEAMADHVLQLEQAVQDGPASDWQIFFPDTDENEIPDEVRLSAKENRRELVDEYLRYLALKRLNEQRTAARRRANRLSSPGSLSGNQNEEADDEHMAFLRGLWG